MFRGFNAMALFRTLIAAVVAVLLLPLTAAAQFDTATVLGTVRDSTGGVVPGVTVKLTNVSTGITTDTVTAAEGNYQFGNVRIGPYTVRAELTGFAAAEATDVVVTVGARQRVELVLKVGEIGQTVTVEGASKLLETDSSDRGQIITKEQIVNLPLNGRNYADLALLSPGVRKSAISDSRDASFNVHGLRSALNSFILDGVDNNSYGTSNQGFSNQVVQVSPDAVEEFKVQTNNFSAEYGRTGGAVINASLRSGTNKFSGTAWEFHRNDALNAVGFFKPTGGIKPQLNRNQFGGVLGGPIVRGRTFFFSDYEGFRQTSAAFVASTLPTLAQRQGNLGKPIVNPLTGVLYADGVIPTSAITPFAQKVLAGLPAPTKSGIANNYDTLPERTDENNKFDVKVDHQFGSTLSGFARISHRKLDNFEPPPIPGETGSPSNAFVHVLNQQFATGLTYVVNPNALLEFRLGISRTEAGKEPPGVGGPGMLEVYGIPGLPTDPRFAGGLTEQNVGGFTSWGRQNSNPQFQNPFVVNPKLNFSLVHGRQSFKTGYEFQNISTEIDDFNPKYGRDTYNGQFSRPAGISTSDPTTYNFADFLFGARSQYALTNPFLAHLRQQMHFFYVQDDFRVTPKLTLNLGMRYELGTPQWEEDNFLTSFDPATNSLIVAKDGGISDRALVNLDKNNFAPRLGLAYSIDDKTVVRGGYGKSYIHFNRLGGENLLTFNGPHVVGLVIDQQPSVGVCPAGSTATNCFRPTQQGYPAGLTVPANFNPLNSRTNYIPIDNQSGSVQSWHVTVQREILPKLLVDIGYIGNISRDIMVLGDYNQARPNGPTENTPLQQRRPIQGFQDIQIAFDGGKGDYHALQAKVEKRYSNGLYLLNSFTWTRARDNNSGHLESQNGDNSRINYRDIGADFGTSGYDQPFNNTTSVVWEVPFGKGRRYGTNASGLVDGILGGWRVVAINLMASGLPVNLTYTPAGTSQISGGTSPSLRPDVTGDPVIPDGGTLYLDGTKVIIPTDRSQPFGNAPRNSVRSPSFRQLDLGIHKVFPLWGESKLETRIEAFNVLNRTNLGAPNGNRSQAAFGTISTLAGPGRQIQLGMKVSF